MEVRVEIEKREDGTTVLPEGCYVAVRMGDQHKQKPYDPNGTYRFNEIVHTGKVDIYQRVGSCDFGWSAGQPEERVTKLFSHSGDTGIQLRVHTKKKEGVLRPGSALRQASLPPLKEKDEKTKLPKMSKAQRAQQAQAYLQEQDVEGMLAGAMRELLKVKPDNADAFLMNYISNRYTAQQSSKAAKKNLGPLTLQEYVLALSKASQNEVQAALDGLPKAPSVKLSECLASLNTHGNQAVALSEYRVACSKVSQTEVTKAVEGLNGAAQQKLLQALTSEASGPAVALSEYRIACSKVSQTEVTEALEGLSGAAQQKLLEALTSEASGPSLTLLEYASASSKASQTEVNEALGGLTLQAREAIAGALASPQNQASELITLAQFADMLAQASVMEVSQALDGLPSPKYSRFSEMLAPPSAKLDVPPTLLEYARLLAKSSQKDVGEALQDVESAGQQRLLKALADCAAQPVSRVEPPMVVKTEALCPDKKSLMMANIRREALAASEPWSLQEFANASREASPSEVRSVLSSINGTASQKLVEALSSLATEQTMTLSEYASACSKASQVEVTASLDLLTVADRKQLLDCLASFQAQPGNTQEIRQVNETAPLVQSRSLAEYALAANTACGSEVHAALAGLTASAQNKLGDAFKGCVSELPRVICDLKTLPDYVAAIYVASESQVIGTWAGLTSAEKTRLLDALSALETKAIAPLTLTQYALLSSVAQSAVKEALDGVASAERTKLLDACAIAEVGPIKPTAHPVTAKPDEIRALADFASDSRAASASEIRAALAGMESRHLDKLLLAYRLADSPAEASAPGSGATAHDSAAASGVSALASAAAAGVLPAVLDDVALQEILWESRSVAAASAKGAQQPEPRSLSEYAAVAQKSSEADVKVALQGLTAAARSKLLEALASEPRSLAEYAAATQKSSEADVKLALQGLTAAERNRLLVALAPETRSLSEYAAATQKSSEADVKLALQGLTAAARNKLLEALATEGTEDATKERELLPLAAPGTEDATKEQTTLKDGQELNNSLGGAPSPPGTASTAVFSASLEDPSQKLMQFETAISELRDSQQNCVTREELHRSLMQSNEALQAAMSANNAVLLAQMKAQMLEISGKTTA